MKKFFVEWNSWFGREIRGFMTLTEARDFAYEITRSNPSAGSLELKINGEA